MSIQQLREQIAALTQNTKDLLENSKGKTWTSENQATYDENMGKIEAAKAEINRITAVLDLERDDAISNQLSNTIERKNANATTPQIELFNKWLRGGDKALNAEEWQQIRNTMSTTTSSEGAYTVPATVASQLIDALKAYGGMREVATILPTQSGELISFPSSDGTSEVGELIAENTTASAADPTFGLVGLPVYKFSSKIVAIPYELLQDAAVDVEAFVRGRLATRVARITNQYFTTGSGSAQPRGVVTGAGAGKVGTTGQTTTIIVDDLIDLIHSVDPAYRALGKCRFMMNDASLKIIRKLKDTTGRPLLIPECDSLGKAMADTILGYEVVVNQDIATMAANAKSILFGDFSNYTIRDVMAASLFRFTDSAYTKLGQVGFLQWSRHGGNLLDANAVKYYQNSAT